jgi:hypothetical protein
MVRLRQTQGRQAQGRQAQDRQAQDRQAQDRQAQDRQAQDRQAQDRRRGLNKKTPELDIKHHQKAVEGHLRHTIIGSMRSSAEGWLRRPVEMCKNFRKKTFFN